MNVFVSVKKSFNSLNLNSRIIFIVPELGCVATGIGGFGAHLFAGFFECDQHSASGFLVIHVAYQRRDIISPNPAAFDLNNYFLAVSSILTQSRRILFNTVWQVFSFGLVIIQESIDSAIGAFTFAFF